MTIVNASKSTETVDFSANSFQFSFLGQNVGNNSPTEYSWDTRDGGDVQLYGSGIDFANDPPGFGLVDFIEVDLSNNDFQDPDVEISLITSQTGAGAVVDASLLALVLSPRDFFDELMSFDDTVIGSDFDDIFSGGEGDDDLSMGDGDDSGSGGEGDDTISGDDGDDLLSGEEGGDTLAGGGGNDTLSGGVGLDFMDGGVGDDSYYVDASGDVTVEGAAGGADLVYSSVTHVLSVNVEDLTLTGGGNTNGTGNASVNDIVGTIGDNALSGLSGADTLNGFFGNDVLLGGSGSDLLIGGNDNDTVDGGTGADDLNGGLGTDIYFVDNAGDVAGENAGGAAGGVDLVNSSVTYALSVNLENLTLTGAGDVSGTGNASANVIAGNGGTNTLSGLGGNDSLDGNGGNDILFGGLGVDTLTGDAGNDVFDFNDVLESGPTAAAGDLINGFDGIGFGAGDTINVAGIDAIPGGGAGNDAFVFFGVIQNPFPPLTAAGSLWLRNQGGNTVLYGNIDGDNAAELAIRIADGVAMAADYDVSDFVL